MKPNLIVIGGKKCGTSSFHYYLNCHPEICMSEPKELQFFVESRNWSKGWDWYESKFPNQIKIAGETSPQYTQYPHYRGVAKRMHDLLPAAKLIYIVRDPIDRIISHYIYRVGGFKEKQSLDKVLSSDKADNYISQSKYYMQIENYLRHYPADQILIITFESLIRSKKETLSKTFEFLGVDSSFYNEELFSKVINRAAEKRRINWIGKMIYPKRFRHILPYRLKKVAETFGNTISKPVISETKLRFLADQIKDDVKKLKDLTGFSFAEWKNIKLFP